MKIKLLIISLFIPILLSASIGNIIALRGNAEVQRDGTILKAIINMPLEKGDTITTKAKAKLQIRFNDDTIITVGSKSIFDITDFQYSKTEPNTNTFKVKFGNGIFKSITGKIGKVNPKLFKLQTKTSTIGIRGTTVLVHSQHNQPDIIACLSGAIIVQTLDIDASVFLSAGEMTTILPKQAPTPVSPYKRIETKSETKEAQESALKVNNSIDNLQDDAMQDINSNNVQEKKGFFDPILEFLKLK